VSGHPPDALRQVRRAVRAELSDVGDALVLVALSGGPDSLALAAAAAAEGARPTAGGPPWRAGAVVVDHGLQEGSAQVAQRVAATAESLGLAPVLVHAVQVPPGDPAGPEGAARRVRRACLADAADRLGAVAVLLGHTLDDQAETVLLGLARGSGARSLAGMARSDGRWRRPLLGLRREVTERACEQAGLHPWRDPHNTDPRFTRSRVRHAALPALCDALGPGVAVALARTAASLRADDEALAAWADQVWQAARVGTGGGLDATALAAVPTAVRARVLRRAALAAGVPGGSLTAGHLAALDRYVSDWRGQGPTALPGRVEARRTCGRLCITGPTSPTGLIEATPVDQP
jgi:tRNA(Ile)-lysidine synthase